VCLRHDLLVSTVDIGKTGHLLAAVDPITDFSSHDGLSGLEHCTGIGELMQNGLHLRHTHTQFLYFIYSGMF